MRRGAAPRPGEAAIVTGGASGLGLLFARACLERGLRVLLVDLDAPGLERARSDLLGSGAVPAAAAREPDGGRGEEGPGGQRLLCLAGDVADPTTLREAVRLCEEAWGPVALLVNNAGVGADGEFEDVPEEAFDRVMEVNFRGLVLGCRAVWPGFRARGRGKIVNVSSLAGLIPGGLMTSYAASKWAASGFSLGLRAEGAGRGIEVNLLCPGFVETPLHDRTRKWSAYLEAPANRRRPGRFPPPEACLPGIRRVLDGNPALAVSPRGQAVFWWLYRLWPAALPAMWAAIIGRLRKT